MDDVVLRCIREHPSVLPLHCSLEPGFAVPVVLAPFGVVYNGLGGDHYVRGIRSKDHQ